MTHIPVFVIVPVIAVLLGAIPSAIAQSSGYSLTVNVPSWTFGHSDITIRIKTANGYTDAISVKTAQAGGPSWTFSVPPNQGGSVQVCVPNDVLSDVLNANCQYFTADGSDMTVNMAQR